tara:strand:+ start:1570 stop:2586 length:1017 start_codon:yes stop_codon:yes gene_type:complete
MEDRRRAQRSFWFLWLCVLLWTGSSVGAHTSLPAYLELNEVSSGTFSIIWRVPSAEGPPPAIVPVLPTHCVVPYDPAVQNALDSIIAQGIVNCGSRGLRGQTIEIEGLEHTIMDVLVRITFSEGTRVSQVVNPEMPQFMIAVTDTAAADGLGYLRLGVNHILSGIDHLLFVFGMLLLVPGFLKLLKTITAFTVAHSITLACAVFGVVRVPTEPVEALIALSIVFLAVELVRAERKEFGFTSQKPWAVSFIFGLMHGLGFAGVLSEIGIPEGDIPVALFFFNVGVELGQVGFIAVALGILFAVRRLEISMLPQFRFIPPYAVGSFSAFWFLERAAKIFL